jgi:anaerobic ribonucleoside-triphosphate reductase activating protein
MKVHRILPVSLANGPSSRFTVWVQGCSRKCAGCFNPGTHDPHDGKEISVSDIISRIPFSAVSGITVSGGEPFEQAEELALLLTETGKHGLHRLVYTGFTYEELCNKENAAVTKCLEHIELLIDGPYKKGAPSRTPWTGSNNQRVLELQHGIAKAYKKNDETVPVDGEIIIDQSGAITMTGIIGRL